MTSLADRAVDCISLDDLAARLSLGRPLRVKLGVDPTAPDIHLGHTVVLTKLREFQEAGHTAILLIGDWTARVGDPSGRTSTRPMLSGEQIDANAETYLAQAFTVLDPQRTEIRRNGEWFAGMQLADVFRLTAQVSVNQLLHRRDFAERMADDRSIATLELLYPLMQAYDSVALESDVELGGTDQLFNLVLGRDLQPRYGQQGQIAMTMPILPGLDGVRRMGKSLGNYIGVAEAPEEQFGKTMKLPDEAMAQWYRLLFPAEPAPEPSSPNVEKRRLARLICDRFHGDGAGEAGEAHFDRTVRDRQAPAEVPEVRVPAGMVHLPALLVEAFAIKTRSEARRLVEQGGVTLDGEAIADLDIDADRLRHGVLRVGKRKFAQIVVESA